MRKYFRIIGIVTALILLLNACGGAGFVVEDPGDTDDEPDAAPTQEPEPWTFDLEWPTTIPLEESDVIRLILIPAANGAVIVTEFANHETVQQDVEIRRPDEYIVNAVASLHGNGFLISPEGEQTRELEPGRRITWHWTVTPQQAGQQSLSVSVYLQWRLKVEAPEDQREFSAFSKGLQIDVTSVMGLSTSNANQVGLVLLILMTGFITYGGVRVYQKSVVRYPNSNSSKGVATIIEPVEEISFSGEEETIIKTLFKKYERVQINNEFFSGYSGARTFMALPFKPDGRRDAHTIIKINDRASILREYDNFEKYVKTSLPPITGRIQQKPVVFRDLETAGLRYTFIGESDASPKSLRQALLEDPDPKILDNFFDTFGPHWWQQNQPDMFHLAEEYDRKLPAHYIMTPASGNGIVLDGRLPPEEIKVEVGELVTLKNFLASNQHKGGDHQTLVGIKPDESAAVRVNWNDMSGDKKLRGEVVGTRESYLREASAGLDLFGMANPIDVLDGKLDELIKGSRSVIHGDLNLENILVGPGNLLWLIDFAETREGHTLFDFAHLAAEIVAHVLSEEFSNPEDYVDALKSGKIALLNRVEEEASKYLPDPREKREYELALYISCLGALKYKNLGRESKHLLFLTAAHLA